MVSSFGMTIAFPQADSVDFFVRMQFYADRKEIICMWVLRRAAERKLNLAVMSLP